MNNNIEKPNYKILTNENKEQYIWRIGGYVDSGLTKWKDVSPIINSELGIEDDNWFDESAFRKPYQNAKRFYENVFSSFQGDDYLNELDIKLKEIEKQTIKNRTYRNELASYRRSTTYDDMFIDEIKYALKDLPERKEIKVNINNINLGNKIAVLNIADCHYGVEFIIKGLFNETLNEYSPEKFEERMINLLNKTISIVEKESITELRVYSLGDELDGILRMSQLMRLRFGIVESTINYANFMSCWLKKLCKHVNVKFYSTKGNHTELRLLDGVKGSFSKENMTILINEFIKKDLRNVSNFEFIENPTGLIFDDVFGYKVLGIHGEVKNMERAIQEFSSMYNVKINYLIAGHMHHAESKTVGMDYEVINVPSIIGIDEYSISLRKTANAGALLIVFDEEGIEINYPIKLK